MSHFGQSTFDVARRRRRKRRREREGTPADLSPRKVARIVRMGSLVKFVYETANYPALARASMPDEGRNQRACTSETRHATQLHDLATRDRDTQVTRPVTSTLRPTQLSAVRYPFHRRQSCQYTVAGMTFHYLRSKILIKSAHVLRRLNDVVVSVVLPFL